MGSKITVRIKLCRQLVTMVTVAQKSVTVRGLLNSFFPLVYLGWGTVLTTVLLIINAYTKTDGHAVLSGFAYGANIAAATLAIFFTLISGATSRTQGGSTMFRAAPWRWWLPLIATLVVSSWAFVLYASYGDKVERLGNTVEGHDAEASLAWGLLGISIVGALNAMSIKSEAQSGDGNEVSKGLIYLALPCISLALVSLGLMTAEVRYLITDG